MILNASGFSDRPGVSTRYEVEAYLLSYGTACALRCPVLFGLKTIRFEPQVSSEKPGSQTGVFFGPPYGKRGLAWRRLSLVFPERECAQSWKTGRIPARVSKGSC